MFLNKIKNNFCVPDTKFVSATNVARAGKRGNICVGNNVSSFASTFRPCHRPEGSWALGTRMGNLELIIYRLNVTFFNRLCREALQYFLKRWEFHGKNLSGDTGNTTQARPPYLQYSMTHRLATRPPATSQSTPGELTQQNVSSMLTRHYNVKSLVKVPQISALPRT